MCMYGGTTILALISRQTVTLKGKQARGQVLKYCKGNNSMVAEGTGSCDEEQQQKSNKVTDRSHTQWFFADAGFQRRFYWSKVKLVLKVFFLIS